MFLCGEESVAHLAMGKGEGSPLPKKEDSAPYLGEEKSGGGGAIKAAPLYGSGCQVRNWRCCTAVNKPRS